MQPNDQTCMMISDIKDIISFCKAQGVLDFKYGELSFTLDHQKQFHELPEMVPAAELTPAQQRAIDDKLMFMSSM